MKRTIYIFIIISLVVFSGCEKKKEVEVKETPGVHAVKVVDNINASNYTYLEVSENGQQYWMAVPQIKVEKGETLYYSKSMEMKNFKSPTLNRTFKSILFVQDISKSPINLKNEQQAKTLASAHSNVISSEEENIKIEPLKDGKTIAEIYQNMKKLAGKVVKVRGKVTKYNGDIMNRNWIHIQDGTQSGGNFDLLVTSNQSAQVGQIINVEGKVVVNKDFGAGYTYKVMLENGKIISQNKQM